MNFFISILMLVNFMYSDLRASFPVFFKEINHIHFCMDRLIMGKRSVGMSHFTPRWITYYNFVIRRKQNPCIFCGIFIFCICDALVILIIFILSFLTFFSTQICVLYSSIILLVTKFIRSTKSCFHIVVIIIIVYKFIRYSESLQFSGITWKQCIKQFLSL